MWWKDINSGVISRFIVEARVRNHNDNSHQFFVFFLSSMSAIMTHFELAPSLMPAFMTLFELVLGHEVYASERMDCGGLWSLVSAVV